MAAPLFSEWWQALSAAKQACWIVATVSSLLLSIFLVLNLFEKEQEHSSSSPPITPRAILSFTAIFSWIMLLSLYLRFSFTVSIGFATTAGLLAVLITRKLSNWINRLGSRPALLEEEQFLYSTGKVVATIPSHHNGFGKVRIWIEDHHYEMEAMTAGVVLQPGDLIRVVAVVEDQTLIVEPLTESKGVEFKPS